MNVNSISKDKILLHSNCNDIYTKFLGLNEFPKGNISSPFSDDTNPSFKVWKNGTFKCNSTGKQGDVWQFVADLKGLDSKTQFREVLETIAIEMKISLQENYNTTEVKSKNNKSTIKPSEINNNKDLQVTCNESNKRIAIEELQYKVDVQTCEMQENHLTFWDNLGVKKDTLNFYNVNAISNYSFFSSEKKKQFSFNIKNEIIAFCYEVKGNFEVYIPSQPNHNQKKVFNNGLQAGDIFGLEQLGNDKVENLIICAGKKDTIIANSRGFKAVTFRSETHHPTIEQIEKLQSHCNNLFICYDNDKGGENGRNAIVKKHNAIIPLLLPINEKIKGYDITDYFQENTADDFQKLIDLAVKNKKIIEPTQEKQLTTIIHITENYLNENYDIRHNIIANEIEISKKELNFWEPCNENSLWIEMQRKSIKVPCSTLEKLLKSDFVPKFNPLTHYFENLPTWDKETDYIKKYSEYITLSKDESKEQFEYHFKKWCVRSVKCAIDENYFNKNAFVLSDDGKGQNIGKTTWIRNLCPGVLSNYIVDNLPKDEKDAKIVLTQNFIINLDELASLTKQEINTLKSLFSADKIKVRFPYDKKDTVVRRVGNFIGSTNMSTFLQDETGSVRWLCFIADKIDFSYKENFNMDNLWSQAFFLSKDKNFDEKITADDIKINELRNNKFQIQTPEKDLINKYFEIPKNIEETEYMSATDIQTYINGWSNNFSLRITNVGIGKALKSLKYQDKRNANGNLWAVKKKDLGIPIN